jgi:hypothetical protein
MFGIMDRYIEAYNDPDEPDRPFFYNERATLSLWAGGIWQSNRENLVLEEYRSDKVSLSGKYTGRCDIWFRAEGQSCSAEAKQSGRCWPHANEFTSHRAKALLEDLRIETDQAFKC